MKHLRWSSLYQKIGNSWKLLLYVNTERFVLNVTGLLDPTLIRAIKYSIQLLHVQTQQKTLETSQLSSKLTIKTPEQRMCFYC